MFRIFSEPFTTPRGSVVKRWRVMEAEGACRILVKRFTSEAKAAQRVAAMGGVVVEVES